MSCRGGASTYSTMWHDDKVHAVDLCQLKRPGFGNDQCRIESGEDSDDLPEAGCEVADTSSAPAPPQIRSPWPSVRSSSFVAAEQAVLVLVCEK